MKFTEDKNLKETLDLLETLRETPERDPKFEAHGRARFLAEARYIEKTVSPGPIQRLNKWMSEKFEMAGLSLNTYRKEHSLMFNAITSIILVFAVFLGGSGATAYAAQDSLPNELLYPVKLFLEDTRYTLTSDSEAQVDLLISFANNRVDEILGLTALGESIPSSVLDDLQADLDSMMDVAAAAEDGDVQQGILQQVRDRLRTRDYVMNMTGQPEDVDPALVQLQHMLEAQHQRAAAGLEDPLQFKHMFRSNQEDTSDDPTEATGPKGNQNADCASPGDCEPYQGGEDPGNADPGNADPGNADPGNADPGNTDPGNADPGNTDPGNTDPGNTDPGDPDPGNTDPGNPDPGSGEPGDPDPGNSDPGDPDPGDPDPGSGGGSGGGSGSGSGGGKP